MRVTSPARRRSPRPVPLMTLWLAVAAAFGGLLLASHEQQSPLDDPDPAYQRPGFLDAVGPRIDAPRVAPNVPALGRVCVVFFIRPSQQQRLEQALTAPNPGLPRSLPVALVVDAGNGSSLGRSLAPFPVVQDTTHVLAKAYRMRIPRDGGYPVGYAVVGPDGTIRYRTEDPGVAGRLREVETIVAAL